MTGSVVWSTHMGIGTKETKTRTTCRVCEGSFEPILSLGEHYVSNFLSTGEDDGVKVPLELVLCRHCRLLRLKHTVPAGDLYRNYWYRSGTNKTMRDALADVANKSEMLMHLQEGDTVLDIGCNDGTLLAGYKTPGLYKIGFDPAENLAHLSREVADQVVVVVLRGRGIPQLEKTPAQSCHEHRNVLRSGRSADVCL